MTEHNEATALAADLLRLPTLRVIERAVLLAFPHLSPAEIGAAVTQASAALSAAGADCDRERVMALFRAKGPALTVRVMVDTHLKRAWGRVRVERRRRLATACDRLVADGHLERVAPRRGNGGLAYRLKEAA